MLLLFVLDTCTVTARELCGKAQSVLLLCVNLQLGANTSLAALLASHAG